jgi:KUP system potassium uptake protein
MVLTTALIAVVAVSARRRPNPLFLLVLALVGSLEFIFFAANTTKIADGGWFPLLCGLALFILLTTWKRAETILTAHERSKRVPLDAFPALCSASIPRVPGTAIYLSPDPASVPTVLLHNLKHNKVLHQRIVFLTIVNEDLPYVADFERTEVLVIERGQVYQAMLHYGFMEEPDVPKGLKLLERHGLKFEALDTTFFLGKATLARAAKPGLFTWRRDLFRWMQRNSPATAEYFKLQPDRVIELGTRVTL